MNTVRRLYVERKDGFDLEAKELMETCTSFLNIEGIEKIRLLNRYDIQGIDDTTYNTAKYGIFAEIQTDIVHERQCTLENGVHVFSYEYLPGQFDQRADSCEQCIQLISNVRPVVKTAKTVCIYGSVSKSDIDIIKDYIINPIESRIACENLPDDIVMHFDKPDDVEIVEGFIGMSDEKIKEYKAVQGFAMSDEDLLFIRDYFIKKDRDPTITELMVLDTYWSDHCRHTTFNMQLDSIEFDDDSLNATCIKAFENYVKIREELYKDKQKPVSLMDIATIGAKYLKSKGYLDDLEDTKENNACSIIVDVPVDDGVQKWLVMFKNETHNHPTEIEPFGGAATCLGGAIRDPLSGRSYVYQAMRITGGGNPFTKIEDTPDGKLPQIKIITQAADGYSSYGNQIGLATGFVEEIYHEGYVAKRMELGAVIAAAPEENVRREDPEPGDVVILIGGRTGRDGLGGATGSSKSHTEDSLTECGAQVQKGNAPTERKLQRLFRNPEMSLLIKKSNDFGAGGVSVAIGELADGLLIYLDNIPKKYDGLDATELALSESQERMAVVVERKDIDKVMKLSAQENLEAAHIADITDDDKLTMTWRGETVVQIDREFLDTNGVTQHSDAYIEINRKHLNPFLVKPEGDLKKLLFESVTDLNTCSKKGLYEKFDATVGAGTVIMPLGGKNRMTPCEAMVAKIPVHKGNTDYCTVMSYGFFPQISQWSCFIGACYAVLSSVSKVVASGGNNLNVRLTLQEYFESLGKDEKRWGKPLAAVLGALHAQLELKLPAIGGKDSMSGSFMDMDVPPTLVSFAISHTSADKIISAEFKGVGNHVVLLSHKRLIDYTPDFQNSLKLFEFFRVLNDENAIMSATTVKHKGVAESILKMSFGNMIGCEFIADKSLLFENGYCDILVELDSNVVKDLDEYERMYPEVSMSIIAQTVNDKNFSIDGESFSLDELMHAYTSVYEPIFHTKAETVDYPITNKPFTRRKLKSSAVSIAKPRVFIPIFPGTNCEYDTIRAFEKNGAICDTVIFKNLSAKDIDESVKEFSDGILSSNIIAIPGGFSLGDEPDGSGKFIATVFRNEYVKQAVYKMLYEKDGLMIGICNGFQALVKLGLVTYGKIGEVTENSPTLAMNSIARHVACMVDTKVTSKLSPWFACAELNEVYTVPVSHGEGRFICTQQEYEILSVNGQIASQYVDLDKNPSYDIRYNPNGSYYAIEALTSADGRILGKMGHSERIGSHICKNIPGNKDQRIFESGVKYFR